MPAQQTGWSRAKKTGVMLAVTGVTGLLGLFGIAIGQVHYHLNAISSGGGTATTGSTSTSSSTSTSTSSYNPANHGFLQNLIHSLQTTITQGFQTIVHTILQGISGFFQTVIGDFTSVVHQFLNLLLAVPLGIIQFIVTIINGLVQTIGHIFGFNPPSFTFNPQLHVTGAAVHVTKAGTTTQTNSVLINGYTIPFIAIVFVGILIAGIGVMIIQYEGTLSGILPIGGSFEKVVGGIFIIMGGSLIVWGAYPQASTIVFAGAFGLIVLVAAYQFVSQSNNAIGG